MMFPLLIDPAFGVETAALGFPLAFVTEALLGHRNARLLTYYLRLLLCCNSRDEYLLPRPQGPQNLKHLLRSS